MKSAIALVCFYLTACARTEHLQTEGVSFHTLINGDHSKRFELTVTPKPMDPLRSLNHGAEGDADERGERLQRDTDRFLKAALENELSKNNFCRDGYLLLGRFAGQNQYRLRGECNELADQHDRQRFPNTIERW